MGVARKQAIVQRLKRILLKKCFLLIQNKMAGNHSFIQEVSFLHHENNLKQKHQMLRQLSLLKTKRGKQTEGEQQLPKKNGAAVEEDDDVIEEKIKMEKASRFLAFKSRERIFKLLSNLVRRRNQTLKEWDSLSQDRGLERNLANFKNLLGKMGQGQETQEKPKAKPKVEKKNRFLKENQKMELIKQRKQEQKALMLKLQEERELAQVKIAQEKLTHEKLKREQ